MPKKSKPAPVDGVEVIRQVLAVIEAGTINSEQAEALAAVRKLLGDGAEA